ncbi:hypothetical protein UFOVP464_8 [uncultured Caudovirales phage]|uniref:Scaffolding protein n=1 Tax=uncultured Caudovirales phage TaxID=2100421 RepID=A0A6J5MB40_9CAUD|nr:hypothetical protein UFOVP464_8 [uncultured Caudovirales phage]CAB4189236.1 hypothetical protein UFOVP1189_23 [uncultured Caudovirales phage]
MSDTTTVVEGQAPETEAIEPVVETPVVETPAEVAAPAEAPVAAAETNQDDALTVAEAKAEKRLAEIKTLRSQRDELREALTAKEAEVAKIGESAAASKDATDRVSVLETALRASRVEAAVIRAAQTRKLSDPDLVLRLLDQAAVSYDENGTPSNFDAVLDELVAKHPVLVATPAIHTGSVINAHRTGDAKSVDELEGLSGNELLSALNRLAKGTR